MEDDQVSSLIDVGEENNFTVVEKKEVPVPGDDGNTVSSTSGMPGEEPEEDRYLARLADEANDKLIDFDDITSSNASSVPEFSQEQEPIAQPDWGPYNNVNNSTIGVLKPEPQSSAPEAELDVEDVLKEFAPASTTSTTDTNDIDPPPIDTPPIDTPFTTTSDPAPKAPSHDIVGDTKCCSNWFSKVDPRILDLIYWRDVKKTGAVFGSMLFVLLSVTFCSLLSVVSYLSLGALAITLSYRGYKSVLQAVQKTDDQHPFREYLTMDLAFSGDTLEKAVAILEKHMNNTVKELLRLFLVEDIVDSLKFFLLLWVFTYVGAWFNGLTLVILAAVAAFSIPKVYEMYQGPIDSYVDLARTQVCKVLSQVQDKVPFLKKKAKTQ